MTENVKCTVEERVKLSTKPTLPIRWFRCTLLAAQSLQPEWALNYPRKHTNCTISLQERDLPTPLALRYAEKQQFCWNWATLPSQSS